jgi:hypothetical protein
MVERPVPEEDAMSRVPPYHSTNPTNPKDVYHDRSDCPSGLQIPAHHRSLGTNASPKCQNCVRITAEEAAKTG